MYVCVAVKQNMACKILLKGMQTMYLMSNVLLDRAYGLLLSVRPIRLTVYFNTKQRRNQSQSKSFWWRKKITKCSRNTGQLAEESRRD